MSYFVNEFVFHLFFFSKKKTKQTECIIMYLHSASCLTDKFTLDVCNSNCLRLRACAHTRARARVCVCVCARARVRVVHARVCSHSCIWPLWMCACASVCVSTHMRRGCEHPGMYEFIRVFLFSRHLQETKLEFFSVWLVCHVFSNARKFSKLNE